MYIVLFVFFNQLPAAYQGGRCDQKRSSFTYEIEMAPGAGRSGASPGWPRVCTMFWYTSFFHLASPSFLYKVLFDPIKSRESSSEFHVSFYVFRSFCFHRDLSISRERLNIELFSHINGSGNRMKRGKGVGIDKTFCPIF